MLRRRAVLGAAGGAGAGLLAACAVGGEGTGGGAEAPRAARKAVTLQYWSRFGPGRSRPYVQTGEYEDQRLPVFMEQQAPVRWSAP